VIVLAMFQVANDESLLLWCT